MMFGPFTFGVVVLIVVYYVIDLALRSLKVGNFTDKYVLITGCDSGFGRLAALRMDELGFNVFAACLSKEGAKSLSETCSSRLTTLILDATSVHNIEQAVVLIQEKLPPDTGLWALINNAGIPGLYAPCEFCTRQDIQEVLNVNLLGAIDLTRKMLPLIRKCQGRVVNTSSVAGSLASFSVPYSISKFGLECYSDILRREVGRQGIKVCLVEPGAYKTSFNVELAMENFRKAYNKQSLDVQEVYGGARLIDNTHTRLTKLVTSMKVDINPVVDTYIHAITSRFPRIRYPVGADAKLYYMTVYHLPASFVDFIMNRMIT